MSTLENITIAPCKSSDEALIVAGALGDVITQLRNSLDHRSLFSAQYNRKLTNKIELLDRVRDEFMEYSRSLLQAEKEIMDEEIRTGAPGRAPLLQASGASGGRSVGRRS